MVSNVVISEVDTQMNTIMLVNPGVYKSHNSAIFSTTRFGIVPISFKHGDSQHKVM